MLRSDQRLTVLRKERGLTRQTGSGMAEMHISRISAMKAASLAGRRP